MKASSISSGNRLARRIFTFAFLATLTFSPMAALAEDAPDLLKDPFYLALGTYIINSDTEVNLNGESGGVRTSTGKTSSAVAT